MHSKREWLITMRKEKGFTQQDVAKAAGVDRSSYAMYESGRRNPCVATAKKISAFLKFKWTIFFANECGLKPQNKKTA